MRYYRPELDALRFLAFLAVLLHHGPDGPGIAGFGLSMFFVLSSYLITTLLIREREATGTIDWKAFYIRRALRIAPLYLAAQSIRLIPGIDAERYLAPLWSILIEEQFYLIWPSVIRYRLERYSPVLIVVAGVWIWIFQARGWRLWYDTPVCFLFFATGSIIAISKSAKLAVGDRLFMIGAGLVLLTVSAKLGIGSAEATGLTRGGLLVGYGAAALGCAAIFLSMLGIGQIPKRLIYGGKISYGLYVFHSAALELARRLPIEAHTALRIFTVDAVALLLSLAAAHLSYQYYEKPFLRMKERFEVIKSAIPFAASG